MTGPFGWLARPAASPRAWGIYGVASPLAEALIAHLAGTGTPLLLADRNEAVLDAAAERCRALGASACRAVLVTDADETWIGEAARAGVLDVWLDAAGLEAESTGVTVTAGAARRAARDGERWLATTKAVGALLDGDQSRLLTLIDVCALDPRDAAGLSAAAKLATARAAAQGRGVRSSVVFVGAVAGYSLPPSWAARAIVLAARMGLPEVSVPPGIAAASLVKGAASAWIGSLLHSPTDAQSTAEEPPTPEAEAEDSADAAEGADESATDQTANRQSSVAAVESAHAEPPTAQADEREAVNETGEETDDGDEESGSGNREAVEAAARRAAELAARLRG